MAEKNIDQLLQAPFPVCDIEWKPQTSGVTNDNRAWVLAVPYITNRAIQKRLDDVFGVMGWENNYREVASKKGGFLCGIKINHDDKEVTKWDGAECTDIEPLKGGISNSMKRAAVQLGIGRYLYDLPEFWAPKAEVCQGRNHPLGNVLTNKKLGKNIAWQTPELPNWALPKADATPYEDAIINATDAAGLRRVYSEATRFAAINQDKKLHDEFKGLMLQRAEEIKQAAAQTVEEDTNKAKAWANKQAGAYSLIPNEASIRQANKAHLDALRTMCEGTYVNQEVIATHLNKHMQQAIDALAAKNQHQEA
ncbi:Rad52/Rad22 family DNA repair protein [Agarivorans sp. B2Z047]|uniref:Rad52/Rad22 family DNA repair protein n=2 Tax=Agarivorans sp. B2Z047 TaxID=2652721 RepID=UPI002018B8E1|nr:Rad52/Rad22 family DNA repair protein [Agarivorans sp. B2Z047]UQN44854.1 hypothetical protein LQZ07_10435 [Agarivorans sp. B2Z047]